MSTCPSCGSVLINGTCPSCWKKPQYITEYSIALDGEVIDDWPITRTHERAQRDRAEWVKLMYEEGPQRVTIVHRRVVIHDWVPIIDDYISRL